MAIPFRSGASLAGLLLGICVHAAGQDVAEPPPRFSVSGAFGKSWGHTQTQIEAVMVAAGLNAPEPCFLFCSGSIRHPLSRSGHKKFSIGLSYELTPWLTVRLQHVPADLGWTAGYYAGTGLGTTFDLSQSASSTALLLGLNAGGVLCILAGPALDAVRVSGARVTSRSHRVLGTAFRIALSVPAHAAGFVEASWQYDRVPTVVVGPFAVTDQFTDSTVATFPATRLSPSHHTITLGLGVRF